MGFLILLGFAFLWVLPLVLLGRFLNKRYPKLMGHRQRKAGYIFSKSDTIVFNPSTGFPLVNKSGIDTTGTIMGTRDA